MAKLCKRLPADTPVAVLRVAHKAKMVGKRMRRGQRGKLQPCRWAVNDRGERIAYFPTLGTGVTFSNKDQWRADKRLPPRQIRAVKLDRLF